MCKGDEAIFAAVLTNDDEIYVGKIKTADVGGKAGVEVVLPRNSGQPGQTVFLPVRGIDLIRPLADEHEMAEAVGRVGDAEAFGLEIDGMRSTRWRADERAQRSAGDALSSGSPARDGEIAAVVRAAGSGEHHRSYAGWLATESCSWLPGFLTLRIPASPDTPERCVLLNPSVIHSIRLVHEADLQALVSGFATADDVDEYLSYCDAAEPVETDRRTARRA